MHIHSSIFLTSLLLLAAKCCLIVDFTWDKGPDIWRGSLVDNGVTICTLYSVEAFMENDLAHLECIEGHYAILEWVGEEKWTVHYTRTKPDLKMHVFALKEEGIKTWRRMWAKNFGC